MKEGIYLGNHGIYGMAWLVDICFGILAHAIVNFIYILVIISSLDHVK